MKKRGLFGSLFGGSDKYDPVKWWLKYNIFREVIKEEQKEEQEEDWRARCEDGSDVGVSPWLYDTEEEYEAALEKYRWRRWCEDGSAYDLSPLGFESEEEYEAALEKARWCAKCEDGSEYGLHPEDFDSKEAYDGALAWEKYSWRETCEDGSEYDLDPGDFETEEEYEDALEAAGQEWREAYWLEDTCGLDPDLYDSREEFERDLAQVKYGWREICEDGSAYGLDPRDYEGRYAYESDLRAAKYGWRDDCDDGARYGLDPEDYETEQAYQEALDQARRAPYPNERTFLAACELGEAEDGSITIHLDKGLAKRIKKRSEFILRGGVTAAKYLTPDGDFLYAQAIKEHFDLPIQLGDEDEERRNDIADVIQRIAGKDPLLAFEAWAWCVREFAPYAEYEGTPGDIFAALEAPDELPEPFWERVTDFLAEEPRARELFLGECCTPYAAAELAYRYLRREDNQLAGQIADGYCRTATVRKGIVFARNLLNSCQWEETGDVIARLEQYRDVILPILRKTDRKGVLKCAAQLEKEIAKCVDDLEKHDDRYAYSRRNAWRASCRDGSAFELDPLDFDSQEEYDRQLDELIREKDEEERRERDRWRWDNCEGPRYGVFPEDYETREEYEKVLQARKAEAEAERDARLRRKIEAAARKKVEEMKKREEAHRGEPDPLAATDKTEYTFCGVTFLHGRQIYYYRTDDETIAAGDRVIVPVGNAGKTIVAEAAVVEKHTRATAPYPVDRAKFVLGKADPQDEE